jgi:drug/metabolite transporter (DMT)-like permease
MSKTATPISGILIGAGGVAMLCAMDAVAKALGANLNTFQVAFVRYLGAALWLVLYMAATRRAWPERRNLHRHAMRGALMALTAVFFFYGVIHLPLAVATALAMSAPIYISLFGIVFLKEQFSGGLLVAILLGIAGSLIIVFGGARIETGGDSGLLAWGAAILAPISYAAAIVLLKHHSSDEGAAAMTLAQSLIAAALFLPLAIPGAALPQGATLWGQIALVGLFGALGYLLLIAGLRRVPASVFAVVDYTGLLWAATYGLIFFTELPGPQLWIGGGLIIAACAMGARAGRGTPAATPEPSTLVPPDAHPSADAAPRSSSGS